MDLAFLGLSSPLRRSTFSSILRADGSILRLTIVTSFVSIFLFAFCIYKFTRSRRRAELLLEQARDQLEAEVQARTAELTQLNAEYKTILNAA
jgi:C4-dicarboxylate-specific signal transduction histidine kinase